jgi:hypothetical protein
MSKSRRNERKPVLQSGDRERGVAGSGNEGLVVGKRNPDPKYKQSFGSELTTQNEIFPHPTFRLGRLPRKASVKSLIMANYTANVPEPPKATNFWSRRKGFVPETWGNDTEGCCTIASQANMFRRFERLELKSQTIVIATEEVHRAYRSMTDELYGGGDTGAYEEDALSRSRNPKTCLHDIKGRPLLIDAFIRANPANQIETKQAIAMAAGHGVKFCINLPLGFQELVDQGKDWDYPDNTPLLGRWMAGSWGGHSVFAIDYSDRGVLAEQTWGILPQWISWRAWAAYVDELHVVIDSADAWRSKKTGLNIKLSRM